MQQIVAGPTELQRALRHGERGRGHPFGGCGRHLVCFGRQLRPTRGHRESTGRRIRAVRRECAHRNGDRSLQPHPALRRRRTPAWRGGPLHVAGGGDSWSLLTDTSGDPNWFNAFGVSGANGYTAGWFDNTIAVDPYDPNIVYVGGVNLYRIQVNPAFSTRTSTAIAWWTANNQGIPYRACGSPLARDCSHRCRTRPLLGAGCQRRRACGQSGPGDGWTQLTGMGTTQFYGADKRPGVDAYFGGMQDNGTWQRAQTPPQIRSGASTSGAMDSRWPGTRYDPTRCWRAHSSRDSALTGHRLRIHLESPRRHRSGQRALHHQDRKLQDRSRPRVFCGRCRFRRSDDFGQAGRRPSSPRLGRLAPLRQRRDLDRRSPGRVGHLAHGLRPGVAAHRWHPRID